MSLFALGINHRQANISQREQLALTLHAIPNVMEKLFHERAVEEAVVLSTCNRIEVYTVTKCHHAVKEWLRQQQQLDNNIQWYEHHDLNMIKHLMSVASGLDSMILGEPQILGQMKHAYQRAVQQGTIGQQFQQLFPAIFATAKLVRNQTNIGNNPVTLTYALIQLAKQLIPDLNQRVVMLIGAGETIELVANYLQSHQVKRLIIANRTLERAHALARNYQAVPICLKEMPTLLPEVDLIISATASHTPILSKIHLTQAMQLRANKPLFIADLAVPRDVAADVASIPQVALYNLGDLQKIVESNQLSRQQAAAEAQAIIAVQAAHYLQQLRVLEAGDMIRQYRQKMEHWRNQELDLALKALAQQHDPQQIIVELARRLTNKFMHPPTRKLRDAAYTQHAPLLNLLKELYEL